MEWVQLALVVVGAYLLGAIPFGMIIGRRLGHDLRAHGSGKTGATNALRVIGKRAAAVIFLLDVGKGAAAVSLAYLADRLAPWPNANWLGVAMGMAGAAAISGHCWSLWLRLFTGKWTGGRGVACSVGVILAVNPLAMVIGLIIGVGVMVVSRYVSLGSITGIGVGMVVVAIMVALGWIPLGFLPWALVCGGLVIVLHHDNIGRLLNGTERKLGRRV